MSDKQTQYWPSWRYGPNGQSGIFNHPDEVPQGWEDHPSKFNNDTEVESKVESSEKETGNETTGTPDKLSIEEIKENLKSKNIEEIKGMAGELKIEIKGNKNQLISKIAKRLYEEQ